MSEGVIASVLLVAGGLGALQTAAINGALPFAVVMLFMCYGLYQGLLGEENSGRQGRDRNDLRWRSCRQDPAVIRKACSANTR